MFKLKYLKYKKKYLNLKNNLKGGVSNVNVDLNFAINTEDNINEIKPLININNINKKDIIGNTPLLNSIKQYNFEVTKLLLEKGADVDIPDNDNITPLMHIIKKMKIENISAFDNFVSKVKNINAIDNFGRSSLMYALMHNKHYIIEKLIDLGAKINIVDNNDNTMLLYAIKFNFQNPEIFIPFSFVPSGEKKIYHYIDFKNKEGVTPLIYAIVRNNLNLIQKLLFYYKADPTNSDDEGRTPLLYAIKFNNINAIDELLKFNEVKENINTRNIDGKTYLIHAIESNNNNNNIIIKLLEYRADPYIPDINGKSPISYALENNNNLFLQNFNTR